MQKDVKFQLEDAVEIPKWTDSYPEHKFAVYKCCFLSTKPNSHHLDISDVVLKKCADTILGNFLVAKVEYGDATTHKDGEIIYGYFPSEQDVEFVEDDDVTKAYAYAVVSKRYSKEFNGIFEFDNLRNSSVEMTVETDGDDDGGKVLSFDIYGLTCLGRTVNGSCPDADIKMVRFSKDDADAYFAKSNLLDNLKNFVVERKQAMADKKTYKIDKSKDALSDADWGDVDKAAMRDKIMDAKNRDTLVKSVYLLVEDGWQDAPSEHLKYPVMELKGDTFVYNRRALASAIAYAKQNNEQDVVDKIEKIYKSLDLDEDGKEEKMAKEIEFAAVDIGDMWGRIWQVIDDRHEWGYSIYGIYEEDNKKFAVVYDRDKKLYRLDFDLTEDGLTAADEVVEIKQEFTETDNIKKFAEPENVADYRFAEDDDRSDEGKEDDKQEEAKMSEDEMMAKIAELEKDIEERDHIIMDKDAELADLREYKKTVMAKENAAMVDCVMDDIKPYITDEKFAEFKAEGLSCNADSIDAWANKVKAMCFSEVKKNIKKDGNGFMSFAMPTNHQPIESQDVWERLKNKY